MTTQIIVLVALLTFAVWAIIESAVELVRIR